MCAQPGIDIKQECPLVHQSLSPGIYSMKLIDLILTRHLLFLGLLGCFPSFGQHDVTRVGVSASLLKKHVFRLASDSLQGRQTGTVGQLQAAFYCIRSFRQSHLYSVFRIDSVQGSFRQTYPFSSTRVARFGSMRPSSLGPVAYNQYELLPPPNTATDSSRALYGDNIAGLLIGTDLKQEVVVLSAHYDHLGQSGEQIFHGADDNASGTAAVLGVAAVFDSLTQRGIRPRRSILFVLFSGEEGGLFGSRYFVQNSPIPLRQLVCDLNADMVGRVDEAHRKRPGYCYLITDSQGSGLLTTAELANRQSVGLSLNQGGYDTMNDPERHFFRSDHYNFASVGIPILLFTSGGHPDYHQPSDTADKIRYDVLQKRATLLFQTAWRVANPEF